MPHARFHNDIPEKYRRQNYLQFGHKKGKVTRINTSNIIIFIFGTKDIEV